MAITDLNNPIHLPNGIDTANNNPIANAEKVVVTGTSKSVTDFINEFLKLGVTYNYASGTAVDPPDNSFRFNNALVALTTEIYVDANPVSGRIDELLTGFASGGIIFVQDKTDSSEAWLFSTTGSISLTGGASGYFTIPVSFRHGSGVSTSATVGDSFLFDFVPKAIVGDLTGVHQNTLDIATLTSKIAALYPLTPDVSRLIAWADIFNPEQVAQNVDIRTGYSLIADYRTSADRYESAGIVYDDSGVDVVRYTGLTENLHRTFGFRVPRTAEITLTGTSGTANINVDGTDYLSTFNTDLTTTAADFVTSHSAALDTAGIVVTANAGVLTFTPKAGGTSFTISITNATGDLAGTSADVVLNKTLLSIVDGLEIIPFIETTDSGNYRINDFVPSQTTSEDITNQFHPLTRTGGIEIVSTTPGELSEFTLTNFPASATNLDRALQIGVDILVNGSDTQAEHFETVDAPNINEARVLNTFNTNIPLGPLHQNRVVSVTVGYTYRVDGANLLVDLTLVSAPSDITVKFKDVNTILNYTAPAIVARVDRWSIFGGALGSYTFTGENELLISMEPRITNDGNYLGSIGVVPVVINSSGTIDQLNNISIAQPNPLWSTIEIPDDIEFRTFAADHYFIHSDLAHLIGDRTTKWAYGLARLNEITVHSVTEPLNLAAGTTLDGGALPKAELVVYEATGTGTSPGELVASVQLPTNYADYKYIHIEEYDVTNLQWRHVETGTWKFNAGLVDANDNIRLQGNSTVSWTAATRTLTMGASAQEIARVALKD